MQSTKKYYVIILVLSVFVFLKYIFLITEDAGDTLYAFIAIFQVDVILLLLLAVINLNDMKRRYYSNSALWSYALLGFAGACMYYNFHKPGNLFSYDVKHFVIALMSLLMISLNLYKRIVVR